MMKVCMCESVAIPAVVYPFYNLIAADLQVVVI